MLQHKPYIPRKLDPFKNCGSNGFDRIKMVAKHEEKVNHFFTKECILNK
jgi:hypothetical protein